MIGTTGWVKLGGGYPTGIFDINVYKEVTRWLMVFRGDQREMPQTPDRFPGERHEEGLIFEDNEAGDPTEEGSIRYVVNRVRVRDDLGVYSMRSVYVGTVDPTAEDDNTTGLSLATLWLNSSTGGVFVMLDDSTSAAVWDTVSTIDFDDILVDDETGQVVVDDGLGNVLVHG